MENLENLNYDELVQLNQEGKITFVEFVKATDDGPDYVRWCKDHGEEENDMTARLFLEMIEEKLYED